MITLKNPIYYKAKRAPSIATMYYALTQDQMGAYDLRRILKGDCDLRHYPAVIHAIEENQGNCTIESLVLHAANSIMCGHGVEYIWHRMDCHLNGQTRGIEYVNMGEAHESTLIYDYRAQRWIVGTWGDIVEKNPGDYL